MEERELLEQLIQSISSLNCSDLGGYLNPLAVEFNQRLDSIGAPTIQYCERFNIAVAYDEEEGNIVVTDATLNNLILIIEDARDKVPNAHLDLATLYDPTALQHFVEEYYTDELEEHYAQS